MYDANLVVDAGQTVTADGSTTPIEVEGGGLMWACCLLGTLAGASTTLDIRIQHSPDNKANYYKAGQFQQLGPSDDGKLLKIPVYIPEPEAPTSYKSWVRANYDVTGASPSYAITKLWLEPIIGNGPVEPDESLEEGAAIQVSAT